METLGPVSLQETTIPNSTHSPPDPQPLSSLPLDYFAHEAPGQISPFSPLGIWAAENSTVLSNGGVEDMEWARIFGELPSITSSY